MVSLSDLIYQSRILSRFQGDLFRFFAQREIKLHKIRLPDDVMNRKTSCDDHHAHGEENQRVDSLVVQKHLSQYAIDRHQKTCCT